LKRLTLGLGLLLAAAGAASARVNCDTTSTALMARLLGYSCGRAAGDAQIIPPDEILRMVKKIAVPIGLDAKLVLAVIAAESSFDARAVSEKSAMGLMQLMPETVARFGVRNPFDAEDNIRGGSIYLQLLLQQFDGKLDLALAAYNAGENAVTAYGGVPPYYETVEYIGRVKRYLSLYNRVYR